MKVNQDWCDVILSSNIFGYEIRKMMVTPYVVRYTKILTPPTLGNMINEPEFSFILIIQLWISMLQNFLMNFLSKWLHSKHSFVQVDMVYAKESYILLIQSPSSNIPQFWYWKNLGFQSYLFWIQNCPYHATSISE